MRAAIEFHDKNRMLLAMEHIPAGQMYAISSTVHKTAQAIPRKAAFRRMLAVSTRHAVKTKRLCDAKIPIARIRRLLQSLKRQFPMQDPSRT